MSKIDIIFKINHTVRPQAFFWMVTQNLSKKLKTTHHTATDIKKVNCFWNFSVRGLNLMVWPFERNLFRRTLAWYFNIQLSILEDNLKKFNNGTIKYYPLWCLALNQATSINLYGKYFVTFYWQKEAHCIYIYINNSCTIQFIKYFLLLPSIICV